MAEKLRAELEILTAKAEKDLKRFDRSLAGVERRITSMGGKGGKSLKPLGEGLSAATVNANEFEKSMAAANARVIAFGASAGLIMAVQRALKETVRATIEVEKSLADINVVLNANSKNLQQFGDNLFKVAGQTGQGFKTVATAATELARQGLGMEKTLLRTKDALILTRLTGMGAEEAVSSLTAAVNSFSKAGITSAEVINKMAKVDQAFAVSSDDLAKAISRVGSSAVDAGVSMDELLAITTAVQQRTARGGAVIGNAFKTIFTRIGRTDVQKKLSDIGVATKDMATGAMLPATKVLENLSKKFQTLGKTQQNQIAESVAGVFQVNILRAALGDLSNKYGVYNRAIRESASATNEAYLKNEQLNKTLDALTNKTLANLTKAGSAIGGATLQPAIENVLNLVNSAIGAFGKGGRFEEFGKGIGKDLLEGIGKFISGPGLVILTAGIVKLGASFAGFAFDALKGFAALGKEAANRKALEAQITAELQRQPNIIRQIERGELSAANAARDMLAAMKASNLEATKLAATTSRISASMMGMGALRRPGRAQGFIPNFADPNAERASAAMGGYKAGAIKSMNIPGQGSVMYNSAETVKRFPGMQQPAIMPPQGSRAGSNYQKAFGAAHGFDPYAAGGFVPNFNKMSVKQLFGLDRNAKIRDINVNEQRSKQLEDAAASGRLRFDDYSDNPAIAAAVTRGKLRAQGTKTEQVGKNYTHNASYLGLLGLEGSHLGTSTTSLGKIARFADAGLDPRLLKRKVTFTHMQSKSINEITKGSTQVNKSKFSDLISEKMTTPVSQIANEIFQQALGNDHDIAVADLQKQFKGNHQLLPPGAEGSIFEAAVNLGLLTTKKSPKARLDAFDQSTKGAQKPFDFEESGRAKPPFRETFHFEPNLLYADAKRTIDNKSMGTLIKKAYNQHIPGLPGLELLEGGATVAKGAKKRKALGHVPNFSPLGDAITRERAAGVPRSAIRVGASASLRSSGNPAGLGVYNTIDEPGGLGQGISRSRSMGINPKTHGVPNFQFRSTSNRAQTFRPHELGLSPVAESKQVQANDKFDKGSEKLTKAAGKLEKSAAGMNMGMGKLMGLTSLAYGLTPVMGSMGMEEDTQNRMMRGLTGLTMAQSLGMFTGDFGEFNEGRKNMKSRIAKSPAAGRLSFGQKLGMGVKAGFKNMLGIEKGGKLGFKGAATGVGKLGFKALPFVGTALSVLDMTTGIFDSFSQASEEEERMRKLQEKLAGIEDSPIRMATETGLSQLTNFVGGFAGATGQQRAAAFSDLQKTFGGDFTKSLSNDELTRFSSAFKEFQDSFSGGSASVEEKGKELSRVLTELAEAEQDAKAATLDSIKAEEIRNKILEGTPGLMKTSEPKEEFVRRELTEDEKALFRVLGQEPPATSRESIGFFTQQVEDTKKIKSLVDMLLDPESTGGTAIKGGIAGVNQRIADRLKETGGPVTPEAIRKILISSMGEAGMDTDFLHRGVFGMQTGASGALGAAGPRGQQALLAELFRRGAGNEAQIRLLMSKVEAQDFKGDQGVGSARDRGMAAQKALDIRIDKELYKTNLDEQKLTQKTNSLKRAYNDALKASTQGIYAESRIKLRESKQALQNAYDNNTKEARNEIEFITRDFEVQRQNIIAGLKGATKSDKFRQDVFLERLTKTEGLEGRDAVNRLAETQAKLKDAGADGTMQRILKAEEDMLKAIIARDDKLRANNAILTREENALNAGVRQAEIQLEIDQQILKNKYKFNRRLEMQIKNLEHQLEVDRNRFLDVDLKSGKITADEFRSRKASERSKGRDAKGMAGVPMASFGEIVEESFKFGPRDAAERFEQGMADVAFTVRDGLKDSIKSVITGAEDFKTALIGVFDKLLDKTLDTGLDMMIGSIFGMIGNRMGGGSSFGGIQFGRGGRVPRGYNQGGVVTGGSGVRDDVMTFMQGGEYVIKKSAAQKIGYSTLNSINSYASGGRARVSLAKDFMFTGDDPTRPTGGGFKVSRNLSSTALFRDDDPQTSRIFGRQQTLTSYLEYRRAEQARRDAAIQRVKDQKKARRNKAYISAAINIGMGAAMQHAANTNAKLDAATEVDYNTMPVGNPGQAAQMNRVNIAARGGSPALVMGGEYIMSPQTTAKYGTGFMSELNRGRLPGYQNGGMVGGGGGASSAITTNNVNLAINIDKSGQTSVEAQSTSGQGENQERQDKSEVEKQKQMGEAIRSVVLKEIERQQRPGGLLRDGASYAGGRRV